MYRTGARWGAAVAALLCLSVVAPGFIPPAQAKGKAKTATVRLRLKGLHCEDCGRAVVKVLNSVKGVKGARIDVKSSTAVVTTEPKVKPEDLATAVNKTRKFTATVAR